MTISNPRVTGASAVSLAAILFLHGCSSGSGGSDVGNRDAIPPTARPQVLNHGGAGAFREGAEVMLSGKGSEDADGPLLAWSWEQVAGPSVQLIERNTHTVSFTAPDVEEPTELTFRLTVEDSDRMTGQADVAVNVIPAQDADKFLSLDLRGSRRDTFDRFKVVAALADGASTGSTPRPLTLSAKAYLVYPPRTSFYFDCQIDTTEFETGIPEETAGGCHVEPLADLTPGELPDGSTGVDSAWPADIDVSTPAGLTDEEIAELRVSEWWNPRFTLDIPRLDVAEFNQRFVDSGERDRMLELHNADQARIVLTFLLTAPTNQQDATLILTNVKDRPIDLPASMPVTFVPGSQKIVPNNGTGLPTGAVVPLETVLAAIPGRESAVTAEAYYRAVDPYSMRWSLQAWLQQAGFVDEEGNLLPEAKAGEGEFAHAVYLNNYDLGFGRDMYARRDEFGNVYSFVVNYATLEGAIRKLSPIITVAMEYSPLYEASDPGEKFVKFFTYADDGTGYSRRVTTADFDGRGERFTPGNCIGCHGGVKPPGVQELDFNPICDPSWVWCYSWPEFNAAGENIANGNLGATFLPWDLDAYLFADDDPAIVEAPVAFDGITLAEELSRDHGDYSRAAQEAQLKKLNQFALSTYCDAADEPDCVTDAARVLVEHWYGGVDDDGNLVEATFDDSTPPPGWRAGEVVPRPTADDPNATGVNTEDAELIYHEVYARHCRMCHTNIAEESLRFDNQQKFCAVAELVEEAVFERGVMPAARLTNDRFWVAHGGADRSAAAILAELFERESDEGPRPQAVITGASSSVARNDMVRLSGNGSRFADSFEWSVQFEPSADLLGNPDTANYQPTLIGASTSELSFVAARSGKYTVGLTINGATAPVEAAPVELDVPNSVPQPGNIDMLVAHGTVRTLSIMDELNSACAEDGCPAVFGDAPYTLSVNSAGWDPAHGALTLNDAATGTLTVAAIGAASAAAAIPFSITDADGETASAAVNVMVEVLAAPVAEDDARSMNAQTTLEPMPRRLTIDVLNNDQVDASAVPVTINTFTQPANGTVTQSGQSLVYEPDLGFVGVDTFTYNVIDNPPGAPTVSNDATVSVTVNATTTFSGDVQGALSGPAFNCIGCHSASPRNWTDYGEVTGRVLPPADARDSLILTHPREAHGYSDWNEGVSGQFDAVLRWIEEGALDN